MSEPAQFLAFYALLLPIGHLVRAYSVRKWLGLLMIIAGLAAPWMIPRMFQGFDLVIFSFVISAVGFDLFRRRRRFDEECQRVGRRIISRPKDV
ncbi:hypothetical protein [Pseudomonas vanderleydeniana]|uniref:Uncharacterized protein n=1 Tax=Pseudomonas vanderleydeniana TaxID=2745495 RepID=A0A9E6PN43_9PSED|nr:hypothetical protein [Pseudomonas vanderleydeniana]QXI29523.1 hypothetical protein HU752_006085 [Pseudomonas vanderleydeniana]